MERRAIVMTPELDGLARVAYRLEERIALREEMMRADAGICPELYEGNPVEEERDVFDNVMLMAIYERIEQDFVLEYREQLQPDEPEFDHEFEEYAMPNEEWVAYMAQGYGSMVERQYERGLDGDVAVLVADLESGLL